MNNNDMTNEAKFVEQYFNFVPNVKKAQKYIKENYGVESRFDENETTLHIYTKNINESLNLASAKEYLNETIDEGMLSVVYGL